MHAEACLTSSPGSAVDLDSFDLRAAVTDLRSIALDALPRMYQPESGFFAFRLRRRAGNDVLEGVSYRYTAVVLIALAGEAPEVRRAALPGGDMHELCGRLLKRVDRATDPGEVALTLWAARLLEHADARRALSRLIDMQPYDSPMPTVELSWALSALSVIPPHGKSNGDGPSTRVSDDRLAYGIADRLMNSFLCGGGLFAHIAVGSDQAPLRSHVSCFADAVYPILALSQFYQLSGDERALSLARRCARTVCSLQGPQGQWWWHYDVRSGRVLERFPVYAVHQDAMGPMALAALRQAGGDDFPQSVESSMRWMYLSPEIDGSLIDREARVIWRKVARREPRKLSRRLQAAVSVVHPALRMPGVDRVFPPRTVDYESRPYHMAWILYAWPGGQP